MGRVSVTDGAYLSSAVGVGTLALAFWWPPILVTALPDGTNVSSLRLQVGLVGILLLALGSITLWWILYRGIGPSSRHIQSPEAKATCRKLRVKWNTLCDKGGATKKETEGETRRPKLMAFEEDPRGVRVEIEPALGSTPADIVRWVLTWATPLRANVEVLSTDRGRVTALVVLSDPLSVSTEADLS